MYKEKISPERFQKLFQNYTEFLEVSKEDVEFLPSKSREKATKNLPSALVHWFEYIDCHAWGHEYESRTHRILICKTRKGSNS